MDQVAGERHGDRLAAAGRRFSLALLSMLLLHAGVYGQQQAGNARASSEYAVKAAFLLNFTKFIKWPSNAQPSNGPFTICVFGDNPFGRVLDEIVERERIDARPIVVRRMPELSSPGSCQMLFISRSEHEAGHILSDIPRGVLNGGGDRRISAAGRDDRAGTGGPARPIRCGPAGSERCGSANQLEIVERSETGGEPGAAMTSFQDLPIKQKLMLMIIVITASALLLSGISLFVIDAVLFHSYLVRDLTTFSQVIADNSTASNRVRRSALGNRDSGGAALANSRSLGVSVPRRWNEAGRVSAPAGALRVRSAIEVPASAIGLGRSDADAPRSAEGPACR